MECVDFESGYGTSSSEEGMVLEDPGHRNLGRVEEGDVEGFGSEEDGKGEERREGEGIFALFEFVHSRQSYHSPTP